jgi:hypothetical protein
VVPNAVEIYQGQPVTHHHPPVGTASTAGHFPKLAAHLNAPDEAGSQLPGQVDTNKFIFVFGAAV